MTIGFVSLGYLAGSDSITINEVLEPITGIVDSDLSISGIVIIEDTITGVVKDGC